MFLNLENLILNSIEYARHYIQRSISNKLLEILKYTNFIFYYLKYNSKNNDLNDYK